MTDKKIIPYTLVLTRDGHGGTSDPVGYRLVVETPTLPEGYVRFTTPVVSYDETTGIYETENTVYVPAGPDETSQA